jgi:predicted nucleic acid-binding protein
MTLVVDASVAVKWVLHEPATERAVALRDSDGDLIAPSLVHAEIGGALWRASLRGDITAPEAARALNAAIAHYSRIILLAELADTALELAIELRQPIDDCFYLALAQRERCALVTADRRLMSAAKLVTGVEVRAL